MKSRQRCAWAEGDSLMRAYHDKEWGVPLRDSRMLWETLMLEGFQAGLAWIIVLRKREAFRTVSARLPWEPCSMIFEAISEASTL
jgi:DNA-3-methyladenine glycosylase I